MNKSKIAKKLDSIADRIADRGVHVVNRNQTGFLVEEYLTKKVVFCDIPVRELADRICELYNRGKTLAVHTRLHMASLINSYSRLCSEHEHYGQLLKQKLTTDSRTTFEARYTESSAKMASIAQQLLQIKWTQYSVARKINNSNR